MLIRFSYRPYTNLEGGPRTNAINALAEYEGIILEQIDVGDVFGDKALLPKEFTAAFPLAKVP